MPARMAAGGGALPIRGKSGGSRSSRIRTGLEIGQRDVNQIAKAVMQRIEELTEELSDAVEESPKKNPMAVALGREALSAVA